MRGPQCAAVHGPLLRRRAHVGPARLEIHADAEKFETHQQRRPNKRERVPHAEPLSALLSKLYEFRIAEAFDGRVVDWRNSVDEGLAVDGFDDLDAFRFEGC
jgi:hypothetical protein